MSVKLTTGDVAEVTGVPLPTLKSWCRKGFVRPTEDTTGTGNFRRFTFKDVLAFVYAIELMEIGFTTEAAFRVCLYFDSMTEEDLLQKFAEGKTFYLPFEGMELMEPPDPEERYIDMEKMYYELKKKMRKIEKDYKKPASGRTRGVAEKGGEHDA